MKTAENWSFMSCHQDLSLKVITENTFLEYLSLLFNVDFFSMLLSSFKWFQKV